MANRSSFGPMALVIAAMSCSFYVACGDDDVIFEPGAGGRAGTGGGGTGGTGGRAGTGGGGTGGTSAGTGGTSAGTGGTSAGTGGTSAGTGGTGEVEPDAGVDGGTDDGGTTADD